MSKVGESMTENREVQVCTPASVEEERAQRPLFHPAYEVRRSDQVVYIQVDLPGISQDDLELELEGRVLTVRGSHRVAGTDEGLRPLTTEFELGDYEASFHVPEDVDPEAIEARLVHGVLGIALTRSTPERRVIPVLRT